MRYTSRRQESVVKWGGISGAVNFRSYELQALVKTQCFTATLKKVR